MNLLHTIGLMTRAEHERIVEWNKTITERNQWMAKFKRATPALALVAASLRALQEKDIEHG